MAVDILQVAKALGELSNFRLSNLELQKISYMAEMLHLGRHRAPLSTGEFEAWDRGPVNPNLYHLAKMYGSKPVGDIFERVRPIPKDSTEFQCIRDAYDMMKDMGAWQMVNVTHQADGAWASHYEHGKRGVRIPKSDIAREYQVRVTED